MIKLTVQNVLVVDATNNRMFYFRSIVIDLHYFS